MLSTAAVFVLTDIIRNEYELLPAKETVLRAVLQTSRRATEKGRFYTSSHAQRSSALSVFKQSVSRIDRKRSYENDDDIADEMRKIMELPKEKIHA